MPQKNCKILTIYIDKYLKIVWEWILWMVDQVKKGILLDLAKFIDKIHLQKFQ